MPFGSSRRGVTVLIIVMVALVAAGNAYADTRAISDGNDRPGRLDIRSASHGHEHARVVHSISTFGRWGSGVIGRNTPNLFAVEISTDGDPALERVVLISSANGRLVAQVIRLPAGTRVGDAAASKLNGRTVRVSIRHRLLGNTSGYRWNAHSQYRAAGACSGFCSDRAPNSGRVFHDFTAPHVAMTSFPAVAPDVEYDVSFTVTDKGGAGLDSWQLQHRPFGTPSWTTLESGSAGGSKSHHRVSAEDNDDEFRVVAVDGQGNTSISPIKLVSVPIDNTSARLTYTGAWTHGAGSPLDFHDTLSSSSTFGDAVVLTFTGRYVAWVAPGFGDEQKQGWISPRACRGRPCGWTSTADAESPGNTRSRVSEPAPSGSKSQGAQCRSTESSSGRRG